MEGLRQISQAAFDGSQKFIKAGTSHKFESLEVCQRPNKKPDITQRHQVEAELSDWISAKDATAEAILKVVCLTTEPDTSLKLSRDVFSSIMANMGVDPSVLYLICHVKDGFHFFPGSPERDGRLRPTWFIGTSRYAVIWTFGAKGNVTMVIVIERRGKVFKGLTKVLEKFIDCISAPQVLCLAIPIYQMHFYDMRIEGVLDEMRAIEKSVGFAPQTGLDQGRGEKGTKNFAIDEIMVLSQKIHEVAGKIKNSDRLRRGSARMLEDIMHANGTAAVKNCGPGSHQDGYEEALRKLSEAVPVIQRQMDANAEYLAYMQYRAENLSQVIIALLTHEDAAASIDLASASRKDSSSMKTIAVMTMVFLPATFFAAFFALPLFQWNQSKVIHDKFWIYWVFTVPSTAAVFGVWWVTKSGRKRWKSINVDSAEKTL